MRAAETTAITTTSRPTNAADWPKRKESRPRLVARTAVLNRSEQHDADAEKDGENDAKRRIFLDAGVARDGIDALDPEVPGERLRR